MNGEWQTPLRLSSGNGENKFPCITEYSGRVYVTWQKWIGSNAYYIYFAASLDGGATWPTNYVLATTYTSSSQNPLPVIQANVTSQNSIVVVFHTSRYLRSYNTTSSNPGSGNWHIKTVTGTSSGSINPSIAGVRHYWNGSTIAGLAYDANGVVYYNYFNPNSGSTGSWGGAPINLSAIVPGSATHETPSLSGVPNSSSLQIAWHRIYSSGGSIYDHTVIHRKSNGFENWYNEYTQIMYAMDRPSISTVSWNEAYLVFQEPFNDWIYKITYDGLNWSRRTTISSNGQYPSLSSGSSSAKYVWTDGIISPYTVELSSETFSKGRNIVEPDYLRSIAWLDSTGAYLEVRVNQFSVKMLDGSKQQLEFNSVSLDTFNLTSNNSWELLTSSSSIVPITADSLIVDFVIKADTLERVVQQKGGTPRITFRVLDTNEKILGTVLGAQLPLSGNIPEIHYRLGIALSQIGLNNNSRELKMNVQINNLGNKQGVFASLGHIYNFTPQGRQKLSTISGDLHNLPEQSDNHSPMNMDQIPKDFVLKFNYPNPFNPTTTIAFDLPEDNFVDLEIFDISGRKNRTLVNKSMEAGSHKVVWDGQDDSGNQVASGMYFYRIKAGSFQDIKKMVLLR